MCFSLFDLFERDSRCGSLGRGVPDVDRKRTTHSCSRSDAALVPSTQLRSVQTPNRIMMSPMCQYSAEDGLAGDWHFAHLAARAVGGAGIVCVEACHVEARGRITKHCLGLWNDEQRDRLARIAAFVSSQGAVPAI